MKKPMLTALLPATPCTPEMAHYFRSKAEKEGRSLADVQREAFSLFLREIVSLTTKDGKEQSIEAQS